MDTGFWWWTLLENVHLEEREGDYMTTITV